MEHVFTDLPSLTQRDQAFLQFVAQVALHADSGETAIRTEGFDDRQIHAIRAAVARLERDLANNNATLSSLLTRTLKSSCCR
jgi:hypothetical protein